MMLFRPVGNLTTWATDSETGGAIGLAVIRKEFNTK